MQLAPDPRATSLVSPLPPVAAASSASLPFCLTAGPVFSSLCNLGGVHISLGHPSAQEIFLYNYTSFPSSPSCVLENQITLNSVKDDFMFANLMASTFECAVQFLACFSLISKSPTLHLQHTCHIGNNLVPYA